tara:strand:+ start:4745 stop:5332 length:588 start_codon:yes stop_codon:yes gene_type:complete
LKENLTFSYDLSKEDKNRRHKSLVVWFFGLSGSGKSTLCNSVEKALFKHNINTVVLDGDSMRKGINKDLGFLESDREENLRRASEISKIINNNGLLTLCSFITPLEKNRKLINSIIGRKNIFWVYLDVPLEECIKRDPKGLYKKAIKGDIKNFTGVSSPFVVPTDFDYVVNKSFDLKTTTDKIVVKILKNINKSK